MISVSPSDVTPNFDSDSSRRNLDETFTVGFNVIQKDPRANEAEARLDNLIFANKAQSDVPESKSKLAECDFILLSSHNVQFRKTVGSSEYFRK